MRLSTAGVALLLLVLYANNPSEAWTHSWHTGPLNCYTCSTLEECTASSGILRKCLNNDAQNCVAVFNSAGSVIQRDCSDNLEETCSGAGANCYECQSHGCNNVKNNSKLIDCLLCDAQGDDKCVFDIESITQTRQCHEHCITALYPRTSDVGAPLELVRTCLDDLDYDDQEACKEGTMSNCLACSTAKCNNDEIGSRSSCNFCTDDKCEKIDSRTCRAVPAQGQRDQCFIRTDESGKLADMGCLSQFNVSDINELQGAKRLWMCTGENCNVLSALPTPKTCQVCNSRTDANCAIDPVRSQSQTVCSNILNSDCYTLLRNDGHTERGCLTTLEDEEFVECLAGSNTTKCVTCNGNKCNNQLHPEERLTCHICDSSKNRRCESAPNAEAICPLHLEQQTCVTTIDQDGNTLRGCGGSLSCVLGSKCEQCKGKNCNTQNLQRQTDGQPGQWGQILPISCHVCNDTASCASSPPLAACSGTDEYCMTVFDEWGMVSARGCSNNIENFFGNYCDTNAGKCHNCNSNNCNNASELTDYTECIYCDGYSNPKCASQSNEITTRRQCNGQCMTALKPRKDSNIFDTVRGCLDDKDLSDQNSCIAGTDSYCVACKDPNCNDDPPNVEILSCYYWENNEDSEIPLLSQCKNYSPTDSCYTLYDNTSSVVSQGCKTDLEKSFIDQNFEFLDFCEGNSCNSLNNPPRPNVCAVCSSSTEEDCAVDPSKITNYENCNKLPNTGCMTRVLTDGSTERGCVANLARSQLRNCLEGVGNCEVCQGNLCNKEIYPADRRRCQRCSSDKDPSCTSEPNAASVCVRHDTTQGCSAKLVDGHTYRGCQTEFICDDTDKQHCRFCNSTDNCNVVDLYNLYIGYPGNWVTPPINCYTCEGEECGNSSLGPVRKCVDNNNQNCATVFAANGSVVMRGCTDLLYRNTELTQYCDETAGNCKFCKSSGCNNAQKLDNYVDCLFCEGANQAACVRRVDDITRTISCHGSCFTGLYPRANNEIDSPLELARGCLDDLPYDDRDACAAGELEHCAACSSASCNKNDVLEDRLSCNYCNDADCAEISPRVCTAYRPNDQCYIHVRDLSIHSMGCKSDLEKRFLQANRRDLYLCNGKDCNVKDVLNTQGISCNMCNSSSDPECIKGVSSGAIPVCQHYLYPECYTHITSDGILQRGCLMDTEDELFDECISSDNTTCQICSSNGCNKEIFPADWQSCLRCDSKSDANCAMQPASYASYCAFYESGDVCVSTLQKGRTLRGCQSELDCDASEASSCRICGGQNCNSVNLAAGYVGEPGRWQDLPLSCLVCSNIESCSNVTEPTTCKGNNMQVCSTVFNEAGVVIARGCSDSIAADHADYCEANIEQCPKCKSNGCNDATSLNGFIECYHCDAEIDPTCAWGTPERTRLCNGQCMTGMYPRSSQPESALLPIRGCLDDLEKEDRQQCAEGNHVSCNACTGTLCNKEDIVSPPQECYACLTPDCEDMGPIKCVAYREKHQCYLTYKDNDLTGMGCTSDLEMDVINNLVAQKQLWLCEGQNCNLNVITPNECLQCNSRNDPRCASNPNQLFTLDTCSQLPYPQCVTHIDEFGVTTRGCLSSLENNDFYNCLMGTSETCEVCNEDNCNGLSVFPADRRRCHQCDSATTPECVNAPPTGTVCPIYNAEDSCVTTISNDVTYRGCSSTLLCENPSDSDTCRVCTGSNNCNTVDLERLSSHGRPGTWQETPISCLTCDNAASCSAGGGQLKQCVGLDNCATVFNASGVVTSRGCFDALATTVSSYCDSQPDNCPRCNSNGCNVADSVDEYVECLVCDSSSSPNCVRDVSKISKTRQCHKACLTALRPMFNETVDPSYALVRNCFDDLETKDRETCDTEDNKLCSSCTSVECNNKDLVARRQSCISCQGNECQNPQPALCANYRETDQCYIQFDEKRSVVEQGCLSGRSKEDIYLLQLAKRIITCEDNNCNTIESLKDSQSCVLCSSRTDRSCAVNPAGVTSATDCKLTGLPECYARVLSDGSTERGCLSSLEDDEFLGCYNGTAADCSSCLGDNCNNNVYPTVRTSCHICNSETNANCEQNPSSLSVCPIYAADDACVTNLRGGITYRDCASSLTCTPNSKTCVICQGDGCNVVDVSANDDDNHGKWQDLPLTCYNCEGADCLKANIESEKCDANNEQDCVTVFDNAGVVVRRACEDAIDHDATLATFCANNREKCPVCKSNNCNNATATTDYNNCIYCDSFKDESCLLEPLSGKHKQRRCQGACMTALYGSAESGLDLIRTCLDDKEPKQQLTCLNGKDPNCVSCKGDACNVQSVPPKRLSCYHCENEDCEIPKTQPCTIYKPNDSCYIWIDEQNNVKQMGCLSAFRGLALESVIKTKRVSVCDTENCNVPQLQPAFKCAVCDSRKDPICATTPLAIPNFAVCTQQPHTQCVTTLEYDGSTTRGCLYDLPQAQFAGCLLGTNSSCEVCTQDGCNRENFPADRLQCYTCSSKDDRNCESDPTEKYACPWVSDTESCQTSMLNGITMRGCSSYIGCNSTDYRNCRSCYESECNAIDLVNRVDDGQHGLFQPLPLKCYTCKGEHCHSSLGPAQECTVNAEQDCKTVFELDGTTVKRRGCSDDVDNYVDIHCRKHPELCFQCKSNECNDAWSVDEFSSCVFCNSEKDGDCVSYPQSANFTTRQCHGKCMVTLLPNKELLRSCLSDKEALDRSDCSNDGSGNNCAACEDKNCNTFSYPADRLSCHVCTSGDCSSSRAELCRAYDQNDFCFAKYDKGSVQLLGCASSQKTSDLNEWRLSNLLHECVGPDCNQLARLPTSGECISCDSSKTPNCAQSPMDVNITITCNAPVSDCLTHVVNGHTLRGCLNSLQNNEASACVANGSCAACSGSKCNVEVFPANRRKCHICNSVADDGCVKEPNYLTICPLYASDDTCVSAIDGEKFIQRGCGSSLKCQIDDEDHCEVCRTDGCNTAEFSGSATLSGMGLVLTLLGALLVSNWRL